MHTKLFALIAFVLTGCATVQPVEIVKPARLDPISSSAASSKILFVANINVKLVDKKIGQLKGGTLCVGGDNLFWIDRLIDLNAIREQINQTLLKHGYNTYVGLIQSRGEKGADILIGVGIEEVRANLCSSINGEKGEASIKLRWEVLDNKTGKAFMTESSGASFIAEFSQTGYQDVFVRAVEMATENLLSQDAFFQATRAEKSGPSLVL